jgi:hypothetical protein
VDKDTAAHCSAVFLSIESASGYFLVAPIYMRLKSSNIVHHTLQKTTCNQITEVKTLTNILRGTHCVVVACNNVLKHLPGSYGRAVAQAVSRRFPTAAARVRVRAEHVGFVVDKAALGQVFSEYFSFPCQSLFHQFLHHDNHPLLAQ